MTIIQAIILGFIQGITEFLPISSSAHLVLTPFFLGWKIPADQVLPFDVLVQSGTLLAVIIYFWKDLLSVLRGWVAAVVKRKPFDTPQARLGWYLILATIPASLAGVLIKDQVEAAFHNPLATSLFLLLTAILLVLAERFGKRRRQMVEMTWLDALIIGLFQVISLFPGISRSGSTISGGMFRHLDRPAAARFSFLMSVPVMIGASVFSLNDLLQTPSLNGFLPIILVGFIVAGLVGYLSIKWLLAFLTKHSLNWFALYCTLLGLAGILFTYVR
jgi:undecaprenyl-diphosphatase